MSSINTVIVIPCLTFKSTFSFWRAFLFDPAIIKRFQLVYTFISHKNLIINNPVLSGICHLQLLEMSKNFIQLGKMTFASVVMPSISGFSTNLDGSVSFNWPFSGSYYISWMESELFPEFRAIENLEAQGSLLKAEFFITVVKQNMRLNWILKNC